MAPLRSGNLTRRPAFCMCIDKTILLLRDLKLLQNSLELIAKNYLLIDNNNCYVTQSAYWVM